MDRTYYLSGPMTGYTELNFPAFRSAQAELRALGYDIVSPHEVEVNTPSKWDDCLRADLLVMLHKCNGIVLLRGWPASHGARLELSVAQALGWPVFYYDPSCGLVDMNGVPA